MGYVRNYLLSVYMYTSSGNNMIRSRNRIDKCRAYIS